MAFLIRKCMKVPSTSNEPLEPLSANEQAAEEYGSRAFEAFKAIHGKTPSGSKVIRIKEAENRAISIRQLVAVHEQGKRRCIPEGWKDFNGVQITPETLTLYDAVKYIIFPVTRERKCSYVETVAAGKQEPNWFVSHWWGEPVADFIQCLKEHARNHHLDEETTYYWVCAYANNQWDLELGEGLEASPFYKAMCKSEGTISVLDKAGVVFTRIWCGYELYISLLNKSREDYKWCVYTNMEYKAIGITEGDSPADAHWAGAKWMREKRFPSRLLEDALSIEIQNCDASEEEDRKAILKEIGNDVVALNQTLKGRFAAAGLRIALKNGKESVWTAFLKAIANGKSKVLNFDFHDDDKLTSAKQEELRKHIDWESLERLNVNFKAVAQSYEKVKSIVDKWLPYDKVAVLTLGHNNIGPEGFEAISEYLCEGGKNLKTLGLWRNKGGDRGAIALAKALKENKYLGLQKLEINENGIGDEGFIALANSLKSNEVLKSVLLHSNKRAGDPGAIAFADMLKENKTLQKLTLGNMAIGHSGFTSIAEALTKNKSLTWLSLSNNPAAGDEGCVPIADMLNQNKTLRSIYLNVCGNVGDMTGVAFGNSLKQNQTLKELSLNGNTIGSKGGVCIARALKKNTSLQKLWLSQNKLDDETCILFGDVLKENKTLQYLNLCHNQIGDSGGQAIGDGLKENKTLCNLDLSNNKLGIETGVSLGKTLSKNNTLQVLSLAYNKIKNEGAVSLSNGLKRNKALKEIDLTSNEVSEEGGTNIANALLENDTLTHLFLGYNQIGDKGIISFTNTLIENECLRNLNLGSNEMGNEGGISFANALKQNKTLEELILELCFNMNLSEETKTAINDAWANRFGDDIY